MANLVGLMLDGPKCVIARVTKRVGTADMTVYRPGDYIVGDVQSDGTIGVQRSSVRAEKGRSCVYRTHYTTRNVDGAPKALRDYHAAVMRARKMGGPRVKGGR